MNCMRDLGLTLAGGGNRSFYQQALLETWGEQLWPRVAAVSCVSAGSAIATLLLSGRAQETRVRWDELRRGLTRNLDLTRVLRGQTLAPHAAIYRAAILHSLAEGGFERLRAVPFPVLVLCAKPPVRWPSGIATWLGFGGYALEKKLWPRGLHPRSGEKLGYRGFVFDMRDCESPSELADLVLASSATPPFTPVGRFRGVRLLDGGLVDNAPASVVEEAPSVRKNLVLLTRAHPPGVAGSHGKRLYLEPSEPIPIHRWDYRECAAVDETLALGRRDGARYFERVRRWLAQSEVRVDP
jgi:predicted acylesterase/phospholipase RssA